MLTTNQDGQTLIEVLIALTVAVIIIGALAIATIVSIRNSQFSQNQTQATKLSQEALELVRTIRNRNGVVTSSNPVFSNSRFSDFWSHQLDSCNWNRMIGTCGNGSFNGYFKLDIDHLELSRQDSPELANDLTASVFKRFVLVEDDTSYTYQKRVSVVVSWSDSSGRHESNVQTLLTRQEY